VDEGIVLGGFYDVVVVPVGIHAEDRIGELVVVELDFEVFAEREEEFGKAEDLLGVGGEFVVEAEGEFVAHERAVHRVFGGVAEGFEEGFSAGSARSAGGTRRLPVAGPAVRRASRAMQAQMALARRRKDWTGSRVCGGWCRGSGRRRGAGWWLGPARRGLRGEGFGWGFRGFFFFRRFGFGEVGEGARGGGAGQLHAELFQLRQHAQVARGAGGGVFRFGWGDGVQGGGPCVSCVDGAGGALS
jgi:hypothetical protein